MAATKARSEVHICEIFWFILCEFSPKFNLIFFSVPGACPGETRQAVDKDILKVFSFNLSENSQEANEACEGKNLTHNRPKKASKKWKWKQAKFGGKK